MDPQHVMLQNLLNSENVHRALALQQSVRVLDTDSWAPKWTLLASVQRVLINRDLSPPGPSHASNLFTHLNVDHLATFDEHEHM